MDVVWDLLGFLVKSFLVFATFAASVGFFFSRLRERRGREPRITLHEVSARWRRNVAAVQAGLSTERRKRKVKDPKPEELPKNRVFVLDFKGDVLATEAESLREEITVILGVAQPDDEVVLRLESSGGTVHGYGLAASQLSRLRAAKVNLTVCVDKVAASGGYMMACVADRVLAAPFAIIGSIGVVAPLPNVNRLLREHGVDYEDITAGRYKRTVSILGANTEEGKQKFREQLEETHVLFKSFVQEMRPSLDTEKVATGEHWHGTTALELGLVDALTTSDDYLVGKAKDARVFEVACERPRTVRERAAHLAQAMFTSLLELRG